MPISSLHQFRIRLLVAAGFSFAPGILIPEVRGSESTTSDASRDGSDTGAASSGESETDTDEFIENDFDCDGCYGRPYVADAVVRTADPRVGPGWSETGRKPVLDTLTAFERDALATFWTRAGLSEHSSIAGFNRFALDLLAHGAPATLVARAQRAALQELEHAQACFRLASAYAGRELGPGPAPLGTTAPIASSLLELAVSTVREGCVGETVAAWMASEIQRSAQDAAVVAVMTKIAEEEAEHAELSWAVVQWAIAEGGVDVAQAVRASFALARVAGPSGSAVQCAAHGLLPSVVLDRIHHIAFSQIVQPCAQQLWAV